MQRKFIVLVIDGGPFYEDAIKLLEEKEHDHKITKFEEDQEYILLDIKEQYDWKTVPMIFVRTEEAVTFIGGYTDLVQFLEEEDGTE